MKRRVARLTTALLFLILIGSATAALALPQADQGSATSSGKTKHSRKKKAQSPSDEKTTKSNSKLDLNTASKEELDALPGIGDTYAQKIIEGRPYTSKSDLVKKGVLPSSAYDKIKDEVTAHRTKKETSESSGATATPASTSNDNRASGAASTEGTDSKRSKSETTGASAQSDSDQAAQAPPEKGMVWVNLDSGVYHREGDRWYGKTKHGKYMSEADAQKAGYRSAKSAGKRGSDMGIFDAITGMAERHPNVSPEQHSSLLQGAMAMFGNSGGISGLINNAESHGPGGIVQSWIGTGANQPIAEGQLQSVVGQDRINELATRAGVPPAIAAAALSRILPIVVDKLTPHGKVEGT